ncbi:MAG: 23S rRNA (adenine(1618)-N(6))-methyltransferase RlmF [Rikenellaceae bacterium]
MTERRKLHKRNKHNGGYDFERLITTFPDLAQFVITNPYGTPTIDFFNPQAVKSLNKALLMSDYGISYWDIPSGNLCPPIPGRADYIHYAADLIKKSNAHCLDIGVGANCIYPIIGSAEYEWTFVGTDISCEAIENAKKIIHNNPSLAKKIELRVQTNEHSIFKGVVSKNDYFDLSICNPPFHSSPEEAQRGTLRKLSNLKGKRVTKASLNFGGTDHELWCEGGELKFVLDMIGESREYKDNFGWFTVLVSKEENLQKFYQMLHEVDIEEYRTINMQQGNKNSRILAWRF